ncbi:MAG: tyrosine-type recombinase/integrase [Cytophagaceae bacterium]
MIENFLKYISTEKRYSQHTFISYQNDLRQFSEFLKNQFQTDDLTLVTYSMIRDWIVLLMQENNTAKTVNRKVACLRSFYKYLKKQEIISKNPTDKIKSPKIKKTLPEFIPEENLVSLLDSIIFDNSPEGVRDKMIFELLYGTGIRLSELIGLKWEHINKHDRTIKVKGKGNKERIIPLNENILNQIDIYERARRGKMPAMEYFITTDKGVKTYPVFIYRIVKKYLNNIRSIDKRSPHVLRHTFATHLLNKGADLNAIKELLGHSSLAATQVYTHNSLDKLKAIFEQAHPKA